jgi:LytS/YehU family sensor histidine kinase
VATLIHTDPMAADRMVVDLSRLLRRALDVSHRQEISLADELELTRAYLAVQQIRFGDRLRVVMSVADDVLSAMVPPLLLQPLAENAIIHGIGKRGGGGRVELRAFTEGTMLRLQVRDDGPGCDTGSAFASRSIGLPNTRSRLEHMYRGNHRFTLRREGTEFVVDIAIPLGGAALPRVEERQEIA